MSARAVRSQRGTTLMEVLVAAGASTFVATAVIAWMVMAARESTELPKRSIDNSTSSLLNTMLVPDVASAGSITVGASAPDCLGGQGEGTVLFSMTSTSPLALEAVGRRVAYTVTPMGGPSGAGRSMLWRRTCPDSPGTPTDSSLLATSLPTPSGGWASAVGCDNPCRQLQVSFRGPGGAVIAATATTRLGAGA